MTEPKSIFFVLFLPLYLLRGLAQSLGIQAPPFPWESRESPPQAGWHLPEPFVIGHGGRPQAHTSNLEEWELVRDEQGFIKSIKVHRDVKRG